jgi:beta-phosphoglucomutase-like phosphatase (HAD superfamily)
VARSSKRYILWDHDGVLVDTESLYYEATRDALAALDLHLPLERYLADMGEGLSAWERAVEEGIAEEVVVERREWRDRRYQELLVEREIEIPGVGLVLATLAPQYSMAIVTTAKRSDFELIHRDRSIVGHMDFVLTSGDYERAKPAPDPYLTALERFGASADEAVVIEDSARGLRSAIAAGIDCVVVDNEFVRSQDFTGATARIRSLDELPGLLPTI